MKIKAKTRQVICSACADLQKAINAYITKADEDMSDQLKKAGYADSDGTVEHINDLADDLDEALQNDFNIVADDLEEDGDAKHYVAHRFSKHLDDGTTEETIRVSYDSNLDDYILEIGNLYLQETDKNLTMDSLSARTTSWIDDWAERLGKLMKLEDHAEIQNVLHAGIENGDDINTIARAIRDAGIRTSPARARMTAVTEVLTAHSVANQEAYMQSPAVSDKRWLHSGSRNNAPRQNHIDMNGQTVPKDKPFKLIGRDGATYSPMYPRDVNLPAGERINCHCLSQAIVKDDVLREPEDQREEMQRENVITDDFAWKEELKTKEAERKAKTGIDENQIMMDYFRGKTEEQQIKYLGGGDAGKQRKALIDSGVFKNDKDFEKLFTRDSKGRRKIKTLDQLHTEGIETVNAGTISHVRDGEWGEPTKQAPHGRLKGGGHEYSFIQDFKARTGDECEITGSFSNGVRFGNVPNCKIKVKRENSGQYWFPESWDDDKIRDAGTAVANSSGEWVEGYHKTGVYDGVAVRVLRTDGIISTVCPDIDQDKFVEGVTRITDDS